MLKKFFLIALTLCLLFSLTGCDTALVKFQEFAEIKVKKVSDCTVTENERFQLNWDDKNKRITLYDKQTDTVWSSTPEDALKNNPVESGKKNHPQVESPIFVSYFDNQNFVEKTAYAYTSAIKNGKVSAEKGKDKISVTYVFKSEKISVTVDYSLCEGGLCVTVDNSKITESEKNIVTSVSIAPFFCSVKNNSEDSYLFVPSGSGALIYSDVKSVVAISTEESVYGDDFSVDDAADFVKYQSVRLPVYGAVNGNKGVCAVIDKGAEAASICTVSNNENLGFAAVYAKFLTRGYDLIDTPDGFVSQSAKNKLYSGAVTKAVSSVNFYPFYGEDCSYVNMAQIYREYLNKNGFDKYNSSAEETAISLKILGGALSKSFVFGVPYTTMLPTTTLKQAKDIITQVNKVAGNINVSLYGFTESGVDVGAAAGGMQINSDLGDEDELKNLYNYCKKSGISLFTNFDVVRFSKSGSGLNPLFDSAATTNGERAVLTHKTVDSTLADKRFDGFYLVGRDSLNDLCKELLDEAKGASIKGIGLDTLSNMLYADYSNTKYYVSLGMARQVADIFGEYRSKGISVMGNNANAYAAVNSDYIMDTPLSASNYESFDEEIPFYQMVFKGYVPMSSESLNLSSNSRTAFLNAVEAGIGVTYTVIKNYDIELLNSSFKDFYGADYTAAYEDIENIVSGGFADYISQVKDAYISGHTIINEYVRSTEFSNGVTVYVNYGNSDFTYGDITVKANDYTVKR